MECVQKQQVIPSSDMIMHVDVRPRNRQQQIDASDRVSAEFRRHLASEKAIRELDRRRDLSLAVTQRMSFNR